jgi:hypothetical protein
MPRMSDFFGGLNSGNVRFTDARINGDGPLPTSISGPEGINGDPDGRYNFNDALLSSIAPYAGPKEGRMGSDRNYQQIPHRKQYPVPKIYLPEPAWDTNALFDMSHPIDMGDLVFIVNMHYKHYVLTGSQASVQDAQNNTMPNCNVFCNICTVNYLLAGIHNYAMHFMRDNNQVNKNHHAWYQLMRCLSLDENLEAIRTRYQAYNTVGLPADLVKSYQSEILLMVKLMLQKLIRDDIKPMGICSTSEKQGGQHETGYKPVQAAASFFVTLTVDGQNRDLVNIWRGVDVEGGDLLLVQLEYREKTESVTTQISQNYVLNHYYKSFVQRTLQMHQDVVGMFQLVPGVLRTAFKPKVASKKYLWAENYPKLEDSWMRHASRAARPAIFACNFNLPNQLVGNYKDNLEQNKVVRAMLESVMDNRNLGYWHIGQVYNKQAKFATETVPTNDMDMTRGQLLQVNFAPVWHGRAIGEAEMITKRIFTQDAAILLALPGHLENLSEYLLETHTEATVWFDLTMWALQMSRPNAELAIVTRIGEFINAHLHNLPVRRAAVLRAGPAPRALNIHTNAPMSLLGNLANPANPANLCNTASIPGAAGASALAGGADDAGAPVKRFKKSAGVAETASVAPAASAAAGAPAVDSASAGWDFEKDLENIFATEALTRADGGDKPRAKGKGKGAQ